MMILEKFQELVRTFNADLADQKFTIMIESSLLWLNNRVSWNHGSDIVIYKQWSSPDCTYEWYHKIGIIPRDFQKIHFSHFFSSDINECSDSELNNCTQGCQNRYGTYTCFCEKDFILLDDKISCQGKHSGFFLVQWNTETHRNMIDFQKFYYQTRFPQALIHFDNAISWSEALN